MLVGFKQMMENHWAHGQGLASPQILLIEPIHADS
jgi:hypothetical protein